MPPALGPPPRTPIHTLQSNLTNVSVIDIHTPLLCGDGFYLMRLLRTLSESVRSVATAAMGE